MTFIYEYRTSDNVRHQDSIDAADRESAFGLLKARGIRPGKLVEAPGFFNKLFGKGKRWIAISILCVVCLVLTFAVWRFRRAEHEGRYAAQYRAQIFGDPFVLQKLSGAGWGETFPDVGEAWLARHAIPGKICDCRKDDGAWRVEIADALMARKDKPLSIDASDPDELKKMKRIINGMKREFSEYADTRDDAYEYIEKACERCRVEKGVIDDIERDLTKLEERFGRSDSNRAEIIAEWDQKNETLRSLGLPTVPHPE